MCRVAFNNRMTGELKLMLVQPKCFSVAEQDPSYRMPNKLICCWESYIKLYGFREGSFLEDKAR
jgi:hypothetical protein